MRKLLGMLLPVLFTVVFFSACGGGGDAGGGGTADTMTVVVDGVTKTYTEGPINSSGYYDPYMEAGIYPTTGRTGLVMSSGVVGGHTMPDTVINIYVSDHTAGVHEITKDCSQTCVSYTDHGEIYDSIVSSGTVTIESIGNVGQPVIGKFSAVVALRTPPNTPLNISGTFHVTREN